MLNSTPTNELIRSEDDFRREVMGQAPQLAPRQLSGLERDLHQRDWALAIKKVNAREQAEREAAEAKYLKDKEDERHRIYGAVLDREVIRPRTVKLASFLGDQSIPLEQRIAAHEKWGKWLWHLTVNPTEVVMDFHWMGKVWDPFVWRGLGANTAGSPSYRWLHLVSKEYQVYAKEMVERANVSRNKNAGERQAKQRAAKFLAKHLKALEAGTASQDTKDSANKHLKLLGLTPKDVPQWLANRSKKSAKTRATKRAKSKEVKP